MILIIFWPWMSLHFPCFIVEYLNPQPQDGWILGKGHIYDRCGHFYFPRDSALTIFHYYLIIGAEYSRYRWACFSVPVPKMRSFSYLQAENPMIQFSMRHYDPSQQLNMKMAAYLSGCGHFLYFNIYMWLTRCYNTCRMITSWELSAPAKFDRTFWDESVIFLFTPFHSHATIQDETLCPVSIF